MSEKEEEGWSQQTNEKREIEELPRCPAWNIFHDISLQGYLHVRNFRQPWCHPVKSGFIDCIWKFRTRSKISSLNREGLLQTNRHQRVPPRWCAYPCRARQHQRPEGITRHFAKMPFPLIPATNSGGYAHARHPLSMRASFCSADSTAACQVADGSLSCFFPFRLASAVSPLCSETANHLFKRLLTTSETFS